MDVKQKVKEIYEEYNKGNFDLEHLFHTEFSCFKKLRHGFSSRNVKQTKNFKFFVIKKKCFIPEKKKKKICFFAVFDLQTIQNWIDRFEERIARFEICN